MFPKLINDLLALFAISLLLSSPAPSKYSAKCDGLGFLK